MARVSCLLFTGVFSAMLKSPLTSSQDWILYIFSQLFIQGHSVDNLKSAIMRAFTPEKTASATKPAPPPTFTSTLLPVSQAPVTVLDLVALIDSHQMNTWKNEYKTFNNNK